VSEDFDDRVLEVLEFENVADKLVELDIKVVELELNSKDENDEVVAEGTNVDEESRLL